MSNWWGVVRLTEVLLEGERPTERVVLLDQQSRPIGTADKSTVHTASTPLHLAFSCYLLNQHGEVLVTRRALSKLTWPGVWTNSFCGHPGPDESPDAAVARRAGQELGVEISDLRLVIPDFRYRAVDASGIVENEICPVYVATAASDPRPHPDEIAEWEWVAAPALVEAVTLAPFAFSPWMVLQLRMLRAELGAELPRAASWPRDGRPL